MNNLEKLERKILKDITINDRFLNDSYDAYIKDGELQYFLAMIRKLKKGEEID